MTETAQSIPENQDEPSWRRWLPWLALIAIILVVAWLIWLYADWKTPGRGGVAEVTGASIRVPDVIGLEADEAEAVIREAGLVAEEDVSYDVYADPGTVSSQMPVGGTRVPPGTLVIIDVVAETGAANEADVEEPDYQGEAKGMTGRPAGRIDQAAVPNVMGLSEQEAIAAVNARGLVARPLYQPRMNGPREVFEQSPAAGTLKPVGSQVHFLIAVPPKW